MRYLLDRVQVEKYSSEEEWELIRRAQDGDLVARNRMVENYVPLMCGIARRYPPSKGFDRIDLINEGTFGLIRAIEKFDPKFEASFLTYSYFWIRQCMGRYCFRHRHAIIRPQQLWCKNISPTLAKARERISHGVTSLDALKEDHNLETSKNGSSDMWLSDEDEERKFWINKARQTLEGRSAEVVALYLEGFSLPQIGKMLNFSHQWAQQTYVDAVQSLKEQAEADHPGVKCKKCGTGTIQLRLVRPFPLYERDGTVEFWCKECRRTAGMKWSHHTLTQDYRIKKRQAAEKRLATAQGQ